MSQRLTELAVRRAVLSQLGRQYEADRDTVIVEEFGVRQGAAIVDIAVVNGSLCGIEIKSDHDSLLRLPNQIAEFSRVFDYVTLVSGSKLLRSADSLLPAWWGLVEARAAGEEVILVEHRARRRNPAPEPYAVAELLWRDEALRLLSEHGKERGFRSKRRSEIWGELSTSIPGERLASDVRRVLRSRLTTAGR